MNRSQQFFTKYRFPLFNPATMNTERNRNRAKTTFVTVQALCKNS